MITDLRDKAAVEKKLWSEIEDTRFGMLGPVGGDHDHLQPMTAFVEPESGTIWFYAQKDSALAETASQGVQAMFVFMSNDHQMQASIRGTLHASLDVLHRDKFWNAAVAAWFPKGRDDPGLAMLSLACDDARVWVSEGGALKFGWEVAKANLTGGRPDLGGEIHLQLA
jgi:general stress protein 26